ncbi:LamG-like jellyroll fold domain-containing protein [Micromonospora sp. 067-2]|uniref:LamG-like jellyroll fold domain-containing protein n=1 Tax=Micromonospora sp. 067-2 TaxID=2789270 RepID=UPI003978F05E
MVLVVVLALSVGAPREPLPHQGGTGFPLSWLWSALSTRVSWGAEPATPKQQTGDSAPKGHYVKAPLTSYRSKSAPAKGELRQHQAHRPSTGVRTTGPIQHGFAKATSKRVASAASEKADVYQNADGSFTRRVHQRPVNYRDSAGIWRPIDSTLVRNPAGRITVKANALGVSFAGSPTAGQPLVDLSLGAGRGLSYGLAGADLDEPTVDREMVTYDQIFPNVDLTLGVTGTEVKESLILRSAQVPTEYVYPLTLTGLTADIDDTGAAVFRAADGSLAARMPVGYLEDAKIDKTGAGAMSHAVRYEIVPHLAGKALKVTIDGGWLRDPARKFPVVLDPTTGTLATTNSDTYVQSGANDPDRSSETSVAAGTFNNGAADSKARALLPFPTFGTTYAGKKLSAADLNLFMTYQGIGTGCEAKRFDVYRVTAAWSSTVKYGTFPALSPTIGNASPTNTAACGNTAGTRNVGTWVSVPMNVAQINEWVTGGGNYGLALTTSETDSKAWKRFTSANPNLTCTNSVYGAIQCDPFIDVTYTDNVAPQVNVRYPENNFAVNTLTPELAASGSDPDSWPNKGLRYNFFVYNDAGSQISTSNWITGGVWKVPAGVLAWGKSYYYGVQVNDWSSTAPSTPVRYLFSTQVPQQMITSDLAQNGGKGFEASSGNYTTSDTDAQVAVAGPALSITRDYNSLDTRTDGAFAQGWSSLLDMRAQELTDAGGALQTVAVRYPSGEDVSFGRNPDGTWAPPLGRYSVFKPVTGGYSLTDKDTTTYEFTRALGAGAYSVTKVTDASGRSMTLRYDGSGRVDQLRSVASNRSLAVAWSLPPNSTRWHVATITTDPVVAGDAATALTWSYRYDSDRLTEVCPPAAGANCTRYEHTSSSQHASTVLNTGPYSFWRLNEATGATVAGSSVLSNDGNDAATYSNVSLGGGGPLAGSASTSTAFNGTSSSVKLPAKLVTEASYQSISMWFRTGSPNGVLFSYQQDPVAAGATSTKSFTPVLYVDSDGKLRGQFWMGAAASTMASPAPVTDNQWHHVTLAGRGGNQALYLDGNEVATLAGTINLNLGMTNAYIGAGFLGSGWPNQPYTTPTATFFNGSIADVAFHNQAVTATAVTAMYASGRAATPLLSKVTSPGGRVQATVQYDQVSGRVKQVTDELGGAWKIGAPTAGGSSQVYVSSVLGSRPVHYWRLADISAPYQATDEVRGESQAIDYNNVTFDTTQPNTTSPFSDSFGGVFNGTDSYIHSDIYTGIGADEGDIFAPNSVELWFKTPANHAKSGVLLGYTGYPNGSGPDATAPNWTPALYVGADGLLRAEFWADTGPQITSRAKVNDGKWHHVVLTATPTLQSVYLDGAEEASRLGSFTYPNIHNTYIGAGVTKNWPSSSSDVSYFKGNIAEVSTYDHPLSAAEVDAHYKASKSAVQPGAGTTGSTLTPVSTTTVTDPDNKTSTQMFDLVNGNRLIAQTDVLGNTTTYGYDIGGYTSVVYDPLHNKTETGRDVRGNTIRTMTCLSSVQCRSAYFTYWPDATTKVLTPDPRNDQLIEHRSANSIDKADNTYLTKFGYDTAGNRTSTTSPPVAGHPAGRTTTMTYTTATTPAVGGGTTPAGLPLTTVSAGGKTQTNDYNAAGDPVRVTDAAGLVTEFSYDGLGRTSTQTVKTGGPLGDLVTAYTYDADGQVLTQTDPPTLNQVTGATHTAKTSTAYDADGNVTTRTVQDLTGGDAARTASTDYDGHGQAVRSVDPAGGVTLMEYDSYGNTTRIVTCDSSPAAGAPCPSGDTVRVVAKTYDGESNELTTSITGADGTTTRVSSKAYYPDGALASDTDAMDWVTNYAYNGDGTLKRVTRSGGGFIYLVEENSYDFDGRLDYQRTDNGVTVTNYGHDPADRVTSVTREGWDSPDGNSPADVSTFTYDADDHVLTTQRKSDYRLQTVLQTEENTYDPMGRVTSSSIRADAGGLPSGWWKFDESGPGDAVDSSLSRRDMSDSSGGLIARSDGAAVLNRKGVFQTYHEVLDTAQSYSVSAWVKLNNFSDYQTAVGQGGYNQGAFYLQYNKGLNKWVFLSAAEDSPTSAQYSATSSAALTANTWVNLVGVFDSDTKKMSLYVNGVPGTSGTNPTPFASDEALTVGGIELGSGTGPTNLLDGSVDNVQVYQRALSASEASTLFTGGRTGSSISTNKITTTYTVDNLGQTVAERDPRGNTTTYEYDAAGNLVKVVAPSVSTEAFGGSGPMPAVPVSRVGYNTFGEQVETQDPLTNVIKTQVDALGRPVRTILPDYTPPGGTPIVGASTTTAYDKLDQVVSTTDPMDRTTTFGYDGMGNRTRVTDPAGKSSTAAYDKVGNLLETVDPTGAKQTSTYDMVGRVLTSTQVVRQTGDAHTTTYNYGYNDQGEAPWPHWIRTPDGVKTSYQYDYNGAPMKQTDAAGNVTKFAYDGMGRQVRVTNPDYTAQTTAYDGASRVVQVRDLDSAGASLRSRSMGYDDAGNLTTARDARNTTTSFTYDALGRLTGETQPTTATTAISTSFGYDAAGNRTRFTNGRGSEFWTTYNAWGLPESQIEPVTPTYPNLADRTFTVSYDAAGRVSDQLAPGGVKVTNAYDTRGRLTGQSGTGAEAATAARTFGYDDAGRMTSLSVPSGTNTISYDDRGLPLTISGPTDNVSYTYTKDGRVASRGDAAGTTSFTYDVAGRFRTAVNPTTGVNVLAAYNSMSQVSSIAYGSGNVRSLTYDPLQRLKTDTLKNAAGTTTLGSITYGYDNNDNETSKATTGFAGSKSNTHTYDLADRLTSWNNGTTTIGYAYDDAGNRTQAGSKTFTYDARNQLSTQNDGSSYLYTARGTLKQTNSGAGIHTTTADAFNQVISQQNVGGTSTYTYDALGRAIRPGFKYSGLGNDLAQDVSAIYTRGPGGELLAEGAGSGAGSVYAWTDQHDDVVGQFTATGTTLSGSVTYDPLGSVLNTSGMVGNLGYQSEWTDSVTGRVNMLARWYNPQTGQFDTRDTMTNNPVPDSVDANRFQYGDANPLTTTDPTGHFGLSSFKRAFKSTVSVVTNPVAAIQTTYRAATTVYHKATSVAKKTYNYVASGKAWKDVKKTARSVKHKAKKALHTIKDTTVRWAKKKINKVVDAYHATKNCLSSGVKKCVKETAKKAVKKAVQSVKSTVEAIKKDPWKFAATVAVGIAATLAVGALCATGVGCLILAGAAAGAMSAGAGYMVDVSRGDEDFSWNGLASTMIEGGLDGGLSAGLSRLTGGATKLVGGGAASRMPGLGSRASSSRSAGAGGPERPSGYQGRHRASGCSPLHSFDRATRVLMADGGTKAIKDIALGDKVAATDPEAGETAPKPVTALHVNRDRDLTDVTVRDGDSGITTVLKTTQHHPFWDATDRKWVDAARLTVGHRLLVHDDKRLEGDGTGAGMGGGGPGEQVTVTKVDNRAGDEEMHDLTVADTHTYYVVAGDEPVLVHNNNQECRRAANGRFEADPNRRQAGEPDGDGMLRGTNEPGYVTSRPTLRTSVERRVWAAAEVGPHGGRICRRSGPNCVGEVMVPPGSPQQRDWDYGHDQGDAWSNTQFPPDVTREGVIDRYHQGGGVECIPCNRGAGAD